MDEKKAESGVESRYLFFSFSVGVIFEGCKLDYHGKYQHSTSETIKFLFSTFSQVVKSTFGVFDDLDPMVTRT